MDAATPEIPPYDKLLWPTLQAMSDLGGSGTVPEIVSRVIENQGFSEAQQAVPSSDGRRSLIEYRLAWARTYLKKVDALENSTRGVWSITDKGRSLTESDTSSIPTAVRKMAVKKTAPAARPEQPGEEEAGMEEDGQPSDWRADLLAALLEMKPIRFEHLCKRLLREAGFISVTVTKASGDEGIDGIGIYRMSLLSFPVYFQCKRWKGSVGSSNVRDFRGAMAGRGDKGLLITTGSFTSDAQKEATRDGAAPIDLIDGDQLCDLLKTYDLGTQTDLVERVIVDKEWFSQV